MDLPELRSLTSVRLKKSELLTKIQANRDEHRAIFEDALEGWKTKVTEVLEQAYNDAKNGKDFRVIFQLSRPEDHTAEYDQVISMLEMSLDEELELSYVDFRQYVMDEWGWQRQFLSTSASYSTTDSASNKLNRMS